MDGQFPRLSDLLRAQGPLGADAAARLLLPVAESLAVVHDRGEVHGAISPDAIVIGTDGTAGILPRTAVVPDPAFLQPGSDRMWRPRATDDVWAMGALLVHTATGRPPVGAPQPRLVGWLTPLLELALAVDDRERPTMGEVAQYLRGPTSAASGSDQDEGRRRRAVVPLAVGGVVLLAAVGGALLFLPGMRDGEDTAPPAAATSRSTPAPSASTTTVPSATATAPVVTAARLESFARRYVATASRDPRAGFRMLTPEYQSSSPRYTEVWRGIRAPRILSVTADPDRLSVSYRYRYLRDGRSITEDITLRLVAQGDSLLIAGATARPV
ncbi:hypothetical protein [Nocardioides sp.]|uniref:hypothetical protein n=1 Tax=Nocardioides sp. TaxID=35761 RepID=UPI003511705C